MLAPASWSQRPPRLLIFRIGYFGDVIVTLPALWAIRDAYPQAHLTLLGVRDAAGSRVLPHEILPQHGLIDEYLYYFAADASHTKRAQSAIIGAWKLWRRSLDGVVYLAPSLRPEKAIIRDLRLFRWLGVPTVIGAEPDRVRIVDDAGRHASSPRESEILTDRLRRAGIFIPGHGRMDLALTAAEHAEAETWLRHRVIVEQRDRLIALAPTAGMPSKIWPLDRYMAVARALIQRHRLMPVIVCGPHEAALANRIIDTLGTGVATLEGLSIRALGALLARCRIYLGSDTGAMHLAAAVGTRCVTVMAAIDQAGVWQPAGDNHRCLRVAVPCQGCLKATCPYSNRCLTELAIADVTAACEDALAT